MSPAQARWIGVWKPASLGGFGWHSYPAVANLTALPRRPDDIASEVGTAQWHQRYAKLAGPLRPRSQPSNPEYNAINKKGRETIHVLTIAETPAHDHGAAGPHQHTVNVTRRGGAYELCPERRPAFEGWIRAESLRRWRKPGPTPRSAPAHRTRTALPYYVPAYIEFTG